MTNENPTAESHEPAAAPLSPTVSPTQSPNDSGSPRLTRPSLQRNGHVDSNRGSQRSVPRSGSGSPGSSVSESPTPTHYVTSMGSRTSAPPGTTITPAPLSVIRKHSAIRGCYGVSLETPDAQRDSDLPDVRLETRDSPIDATLYLHGVRGVPANEATRRARIDVRTASTVRLRVQRDEGVSVDAIVATTKSRIYLWLPNDFDGLLTVHCKKAILSPCLKEKALERETPGETSHTWYICLKKDTSDPALYRTASNSIPAEAGGNVWDERRPSTGTASDAIPAPAHARLPGPDRVFAHAHSTVRIYAHIDEEEGSKCLIL